MFRQYAVLFFSFMLILCAHSQGTIPAFKTSNQFTAAEQIKALKNGALVVRLKTNDRSVEAYRRAGKTELADKITAEQNELNQKIADAFRYYFTFCKVYFIYAKNTPDLLNRTPGIFLNDKLQRDTSISLKEDFYLIAEYGSYTQNERTDEYHYAGVYRTEPSNSTASTSAFVVLDTTLTQLQEPFPFSVPVYLGGFIKGASQLSLNMDKAYMHLLFKEDEKKLKGPPPR